MRIMAKTRCSTQQAVATQMVLSLDALTYEERPSRLNMCPSGDAACTYITFMCTTYRKVRFIWIMLNLLTFPNLEI